MQKNYPAKILLFGEYTIIKGSEALAVPLLRYRGHWAQAAPTADRSTLQQKLPDLHRFLSQKPIGQLLDLPAFQQDLNNGWYFHSTIPGGYGAGSSGALCAAIFDKYGPQKNEASLHDLRQQLAQVEHFFHGSSSGIDPLICYLQTTIRIFTPEQLLRVQLPKQTAEAPTFFLLNTQLPRETAPLVKIFLEKEKVVDFAEQVLPTLIDTNNQAIEHLLQGQWNALDENMRSISRLQLEHFSEMIPLDFRGIWEAGLIDAPYQLKLCGAGGGGFLLGYTHDWAASKSLLENYELIPLPLFAD